MNAFQEAIVAHAEWKRTFEQSIRAGGEDLSVDAIRVDDRCLLGQWLQGSSGPVLPNPTGWAMLREVHAEFHRAAAELLALAQAGRIREAARALAGDSQYVQWSEILVHALARYAEADDPEDASRSTAERPLSSLSPPAN